MGADGMIDLDVKDKPLAEVARFIAEQGGAKLRFGTNRDGLPLAEDDTCRVTLKLEGAYWETALKLAVDTAGARLRRLESGDWFVFQPPRYALVLRDADLGTVVSMVARLGNLNVVFNPEVVQGRKVTMRLKDLAWSKVLEVVVKAAGLALVVYAGDAGPRIERKPDEKREGVARSSPASARTSSSVVPRLQVTTILYRTDGGKSMAVVNGIALQEGEKLPPASLKGYAGAVKEAVLEKVLSERLVRVRVDGKSIDVPLQGN